MTSAIASSITAAVDAPQPVNLDAEKAKCESQLADWVHCVSATTPEGKAKIETLSAQLASIKSKIDKADRAKQDAAPPKADSSPVTRPTATLGNHLDEFA